MPEGVATGCTRVGAGIGSPFSSTWLYFSTARSVRLLFAQSFSKPSIASAGATYGALVERPSHSASCDAQRLYIRCASFALRTSPEITSLPSTRSKLPITRANGWIVPAQSCVSSTCAQLSLSHLMTFASTLRVFSGFSTATRPSMPTVTEPSAQRFRSYFFVSYRQCSTTRTPLSDSQPFGYCEICCALTCSAFGYAALNSSGSIHVSTSHHFASAPAGSTASGSQ